MTPERFSTITSTYAKQRIAIVGDFCLDRYLEIDPQRPEISLETNLPVHNIVRVRSQPGAAGTILNNLVALGIGEIILVGFGGVDGEGFELRRALESLPGVSLKHFLETPERRTFTYCKPLLMHPGKPPQELNRLDSKNWSPTPASVAEKLAHSVREIASQVDALILMDQVDLAETGVVTEKVRQAISEISQKHPELFILADSRRSLKGFPKVCWKMNGAEMQALTGQASASPKEAMAAAFHLARTNGRPVFVSLSERGIVGAEPTGLAEHIPCFPVRGEIDIVGAGDSVTANLTAALAGGASLRDSLELSMAAASVVIHQLGTTGTAGVDQLSRLVVSTHSTDYPATDPAPTGRLSPSPGQRPGNVPQRENKP